jgi:hypothetical protein
MFTVIISVVFGVCGWMIAKLLFEPVKEILDLRREAQECLIVYGNLSKDAPPDERRMAAESFRRIGVGLVSRYNAGYPWVTWCVRRFWDINSAGAFLIVSFLGSKPSSSDEERLEPFFSHRLTP